MKRMRSCWLVLVVVLASGCLEKPAPWKPDGWGLPDSVLDGEMLTGDGIVTGDLADVVADTLPPDGDAHGQDWWDTDGAPDDKTGPEVGDTVELEVHSDADVPPVTPGAPVLFPGVFSGWSSGGQFTLRPVGPGGPASGMTMSGGKWTLSACRGGE